MKTRAALGLVALLALADRAGAGVYPYDIDVGEGSRNNRLDVSAGACDPSLGCFDADGLRCDLDPGRTCNLAGVPAGRCSEGISACVWPGRAGFCSIAPAIPCLSNNGSTTGPSRMCPGGGSCDMSTNDPSCTCDGTLPATDPNLGEYTVCAGTFARCSDGDPFRPYLGKGTSTCMSLGLTGVDLRIHCGDDAGKDPDQGGPRWEEENPRRIDGYCNGQDGMFTTRAALGFVDPLHLAPQGQRCHDANPQAPACPSCSPCPSGTCS